MNPVPLGQPTPLHQPLSSVTVISCSSREGSLTCQARGGTCSTRIPGTPGPEGLGQVMPRISATFQSLSAQIYSAFCSEGTWLLWPCHYLDRGPQS